MYTEFYKLTDKPFQISSDPSFLWLGEKHREGLATLRYGVLDNRGFLLLTGDVGTGKTTLVNALLKSLGDDVICSFVPDPNLEKLEFYNFIAQGFGMNQEFTTKGSFLIQFAGFLHQAHAENKKVLLIIDESQLLTQELLEEIRLLSNIEKAEAKLLNIFFVGQNEFNAIITKTQNRAVRQRITINYNIETLTLGETKAYVRHRLKVAGTEAMIFSPGALKEIFRCSQGFPRRINVICDHALISGYVKERSIIDGSIINECAKETNIFDRGIIPDFYDPSIEHKNGGGKEDDTKAAVPPQTAAGKNVHEKRSRNRQEPISVKYTIARIVLFLIICSGFLLFSEPLKDFFGNSSTGQKISIINNVPEKTDESHKTDESPEIEKKPLMYDIKENSSSLITPSSQTEEPDIEIAEDVPQEPGGKPGDEIAALLLKETMIVRFEKNTTEFTELGQQVLDELVRVLALHPATHVNVKGYTDSSGYSDQNIALSAARALIVKKYLVANDADPERITAAGMGSQNPIASNETRQGREMNRRVEIEVVNSP